MRTCPFCGTENEVFFRFCLGCGADLDEELGTAEMEEPKLAAVETAPKPVSSSPTPASEAPKERREAPPAKTRARPKPAPKPEKAAAPKRAAVTPEADDNGGRVILILEDGTDGAVYDLSTTSTVIGREGADINFPHDDFLAPRHAEFYHEGQNLNLRPLKSTNGVFVQVTHEVELKGGDVFRIGQELLKFELLSEVASDLTPDDKGGAVRLGSPVPDGAWGRLAQLIAPATWGAVYLLGGSDIYLGRERGDITFPGDGFVSGLHAVLMQRDDRYYLKDLGSSNGTYYRLGAPQTIRRGSLVLAGQQLFRVEY